MAGKGTSNFKSLARVSITRGSMVIGVEKRGLADDEEPNDVSFDGGVGESPNEGVLKAMTGAR